MAALTELTARQREILELVAQGLTNKEIAVRLFLSPQTVKNHLMKLADQLGFRGRAGMAVYAYRNGLI